jgi:hypothetical protein
LAAAVSVSSTPCVSVTTSVVLSTVMALPTTIGAVLFRRCRSGMFRFLPS